MISGPSVGLLETHKGSGKALGGADCAGVERRHRRPAGRDTSLSRERAIGARGAEKGRDAGRRDRDAACLTAQIAMVYDQNAFLGNRLNSVERRPLDAFLGRGDAFESVEASG